MIDVEMVSIDININSDFVRMVTMQPFIQIDSSKEPYKWNPQAIKSQMKAIGQTLEIASDQSKGPPAQFTIFPEYALPGLDAVYLIEKELASTQWPNNTVVIAGIDGLQKSDYESLYQNLDITIAPKNMPDCVNDDQWVNCCFIWVKNRQGNLNRWIQLKIRPAWSEQNIRYTEMFQGSLVYVFECQYSPVEYPCRFMTLICYDWVVKHSDKTVSQEVLHQLNDKWKGEPKPLDWTFVIQYNPIPNHVSFLNNTAYFLTNRTDYQYVGRDDAAILHINTATDSKPARKGSYAQSACVFSPRSQFECNSCQPTVYIQPKGLKRSSILARCKDVVFREMGECIHSFQIRIPRFVQADATGRTLPLAKATVHGTNALKDPRVAGCAVPASVKWINDLLDTIDKVSETDLSGCPLQNTAIKIEPDIIKAMRYSKPESIESKMNFAVSNFSKRTDIQSTNILKNADVWEDDGIKGLKHILHALTALGLSYTLDATNALLHALIETNKGFIQVVAIKGKTHQDCRQHFDSNVHISSPDPIMVITRDQTNLTPTEREFNKIYDTNHDTGFKILDYNSLISMCRESNTKQELRGKLNGHLPEYRKII